SGHPLRGRTSKVARAITRALLSIAIAFPLGAATRLIIDTDSGVDDLMAIAFLLRQPSIKIVGIVTVNGITRPDVGARNVRRLLAVAHRQEIPVCAGSDRPLGDGAQFPEVWRSISEDLNGVRLPAQEDIGPTTSAAAFYARELRVRGTTVLALGPMTNL